MSISENKPGDRILNVRFTEDAMSVDLADGRTITVPLALYPVLLHATESERAQWEVSGAGFGLHWPGLDEDLSVHGIIHGVPSAGAGKPGSGTA
jgi:hypothetical protein